MSAPMHPPLSFKHALLAMLGLSLVLMLSALDQTVIGNALPSIVAELDGFELYAWVATGYLLASIVTIPIFGRLGDYFGRKPFVIAATLIFTLASLACALASDMLWLVIGRTLQGVGGGMLIGTAFACIPELFPDTRQRLRWQMLLSALFSVVKNPLIISVLAAVPFAVFKIGLPGWLQASGEYLASMTLPLALICIGGTLSLASLRKSGNLALSASLVKMISLPFLATLGAWLCGFRGPELGTLFLYFASPTAAASYVMARAANGNHELAASIIVITTLMAAITTNIGIFVLQWGGWI